MLPNNTKRLIASLCVALLWTPALYVCALADPVTDNFGQKIERSVDTDVTLARSLRRSDVDRSISILRDVTAKNPEYYWAWYNYALALYAKDEVITEQVEKAFENTIAIRDKYNIRDGSIFNSAGWAYLNARKYATAEQLLLRGLNFETGNRDWTNSALFYNLGRLYFEIGDTAKATDFLKKAVDKNNQLAKELLGIVEKVEKRS